MSIELDFASVLSQWPLLLKGVAWTLGLTAVSAVLGVLLGIACAWVRTEGPAWSRPAVATYVELIRNTPFIIQLFFIFFGLPRSYSMIHQQDVLAANRFRAASLIILPIVILTSALVEILMNKYLFTD